MKCLSRGKETRDNIVLMSRFRNTPTQLMWSFKKSVHPLPLCCPCFSKHNLLLRKDEAAKTPSKSYQAGGPGWSFIAEYDADELADDSDNERKIEKAEKAAERKAAMARKKQGHSVQQSASYGREIPSNRLLQGRRVLDVVPTESPAVSPGRKVCPATGAGTCFFCGEFGHFRRNCPKGGASAAAKQYPFECDIYNDCDLYDLLPVGHHIFEGQAPDVGLSTPVCGW